MKNTLLITLLALSSISVTNALTPEKKEGNKTTIASPNNVDETKVVIEHLTNESFKKKVFNYTDNKDWKYEGNVPCIIDFYADWCGPCKRIAPILEELAQEYDGKVIIYKVNTEKERELAGAFGIKSIPAILFVPASGQPQMAQGALPKESFVEAINEVLLKK